MTKERLEELQEMAADAIGLDIEGSYGEALSEACSEIERLMAAVTEARTAAEKVSECCGCSGGYYPGFPWEEESKS